MSAKEPNDLETLDTLLTQWQARADVLALPAATDLADAQAELAADELPLPPFDIGWAAGIFDGEGCLHIACQRGRRGGVCSYHLRASMTQNDLAVLEHFQRGLGVGGTIYKVARLPSHSRQVYTLNYATRDTIALLQRLGPHFVRKRAELGIARRFWQSGAPGAYPGPKGVPPQVRALREQLYREMACLKRAPIPGSS